MRMCAYFSIRRFMARLMVCHASQHIKRVRNRGEKAAHISKVTSQTSH